MAIYENLSRFFIWYDRYSNNEFKTYDNKWLAKILMSELSLKASNQGGENIIYELPAHETITGNPETYTFKQNIEEIDGSCQQTFTF